jgi:hypothetical protein
VKHVLAVLLGLMATYVLVAWFVAYVADNQLDRVVVDGYDVVCVDGVQYFKGLGPRIDPMSLNPARC